MSHLLFLCYDCLRRFSFKTLICNPHTIKFTFKIYNSVVFSVFRVVQPSPVFLVRAFFFFFFFWIFMVTPAAYCGSHSWVLFRATTFGHSNARSGAMSVAHITAHGNTRSLTHWPRPGIEPATSSFLVRFVSAVPRWELQLEHFYYSIKKPLSI